MGYLINSINSYYIIVASLSLIDLLLLIINSMFKTFKIETNLLIEGIILICIFIYSILIIVRRNKLKKISIVIPIFIIAYVLLMILLGIINGLLTYLYSYEVYFISNSICFKLFNVISSMFVLFFSVYFLYFKHFTKHKL